MSRKETSSSKLREIDGIDQEVAIKAKARLELALEGNSIGRVIGKTRAYTCDRLRFVDDQLKVSDDKTIIDFHIPGDECDESGRIPIYASDLEDEAILLEKMAKVATNLTITTEQDRLRIEQLMIDPRQLIKPSDTNKHLREISLGAIDLYIEKERAGVAWEKARGVGMNGVLVGEKHDFSLRALGKDFLEASIFGKKSGIVTKPESKLLLLKGDENYVLLQQIDDGDGMTGKDGRGLIEEMINSEAR